MKNPSNLSRRQFIARSAMATAGAVSLPSFVTSCASGEGAKETKLKEVAIPELLAQAPDGKPLKAGLIGCGGRGTGAAVDFVSAGNGLTIGAMADLFDDKLQASRKQLSEKGITVPDDKCFVGFDAYKKVIESDVDVILICTPTAFHPEQYEAAVAANKHVFVEKPATVDPYGARRMLMASKQADQKGLKVISGTIYRSKRDVLETYKRVAGGMIGDIVSAHLVRNGSALWYVSRKPGMTDMEYMMRNWGNFCFLSGEFNVEQHVHEVDKMVWFMGKLPVKAMGYGGRQRRPNGDQYDNISIEYTFEGGIKSHSATRQINGCDNCNTCFVYGTKGYTNCADTIYNLDGSIMWQYPTPKKDEKDSPWAITNPYVQEHIRLVTAIRRNEPLNDTETLVQSTLVAMMGRMSAYTGKDVTWDQVISSDLRLTPETWSFDLKKEVIDTPPVIGTAPEAV